MQPTVAEESDEPPPFQPSTESFAASVPPALPVQTGVEDLVPEHSSSARAANGLSLPHESSTSLAPTAMTEPNRLFHPFVTTEPNVPDSLSSSFMLDETVNMSPRTSKSSFYDTPAMPLPRNSLSSLLEGAATSPKVSRSSLHDVPGSFLPEASSSALNEPLIAPTPQGTATFMQSGHEDALRGPSEAEMAVSSKPVERADVPMHHAIMHHPQSPLASPPLSPFLNAPVGPIGSPSPLPQHYAQPYPFQYPNPFMGPPQMVTPQLPPTFYPPPFMSPAMGYSHPGEIARVGSAGAEDERSRLLEKVSNALPDLNRLLHYYQESQGLLSEKEDLVKRNENQHVEETARLRIELSACREEYEKLIGEQASENLRLKTELSEQAERLVLLENQSDPTSQPGDGVRELRNECEVLSKAVDTARAETASLAEEKNLLENELQILRVQLHDERARHERFLAESRHAHDKDMAAKEEQHARVLHEHKMGISKIQLDLAGMITKHSQQKKDLDSARASISEQESLVAERAKELEDVKRAYEDELRKARDALDQQIERHKQESAHWSQELSQISARHEEEIGRLRDAQRREIESAQHASQQQSSELQKQRLQAEDLRRELQDERHTLKSLQVELAKVQESQRTLQQRDEQSANHHADLVKAMGLLRSKQAEWQRESERMDRILQSLGEHHLKNLKPDKPEGEKVS
jgi:hypothetical protein